MSPGDKRAILNAYTREATNIELTELAISLLERVGTVSALRCVKSLKYQQQQTLRRLDKHAADLGAPY